MNVNQRCGLINRLIQPVQNPTDQNTPDGCNSKKDR